MKQSDMDFQDMICLRYLILWSCLCRYNSRCPSLILAAYRQPTNITNGHRLHQVFEGWVWNVQYGNVSILYFLLFKCDLGDYFDPSKRQWWSYRRSPTTRLESALLASARTLRSLLATIAHGLLLCACLRANLQRGLSVVEICSAPPTSRNQERGIYRYPAWTLNRTK